jgi:hypothetical protein
MNAFTLRKTDHHKVAGEGNNTMPKSTRNTGRPWIPADVVQLKELVKQNTPTRVIGLKLGRTETAIRSKATSEGVSLKPANQSPYNRRNK